MGTHLAIADSGYHQFFVEETQYDSELREPFFNNATSFPLSHSSCDFRFSLPGQNLTDDYRKYIRGFFVNEPCVYNHTVFGHAAILFDAVRNPPPSSLQRGARAAVAMKKASAMFRSYNQKLLKLPGGLAGLKTRGGGSNSRQSTRRSSLSDDYDLPEIDFSSENEKRLTYQLVFQTLKYQRFLQDMLKDSKFFEINSEYEEEWPSVMVILCDYKLRKFQRRLPTPGEVLVPKLSWIEESLYRSRTRLNAALARSRIKSQVLSIDWLLPDSVRKNDMIGAKMHVACWVNFLKCSMFYVKNDLIRDGFTEVQEESELVGKTFLIDKTFYDVILFPNDLLSFIEHYFMVSQGMLVMQDKSSSVGPHCIKRLMSDDDDVLHINVGSGLTSVHLASLTHRTTTVIYAYGIRSDRQQRTVLKNLDRLGARSRVRIVTSDFLSAGPNDEKLRDIKVVLVTALCSKSGVANPVNFVVTEGEDLSLLRELSIGYTDINKIGDLVIQHQAELRHALRFGRVQGVVYTTRSLIDAENEHVVSSAIEYISSSQQSKMPFRVSPPVLPLTEAEIDGESPLAGKFLKYMPTLTMSGCFVASITREADDPKEAAKGILARAAARGIIAGAGVPEIPIVKREPKPVKKKQKVKKEVKPKEKNKHTNADKLDKASKPSPRSENNTPEESSGENTSRRTDVENNNDTTDTAAVAADVASEGTRPAAQPSVAVNNEAVSGSSNGQLTVRSESDSWMKDD